MNVQVLFNSVTLRVCANETRAWAERPGRRWPCSTLAGKCLTARFDASGLLDVRVGHRAQAEARDLDGRELSAFCADALENRLPKDHPAYYVAVAQHLERRAA